MTDIIQLTPTTSVLTHTRINKELKTKVDTLARKYGVPSNRILNTLLVEGLKGVTMAKAMKKTGKKKTGKKC